MKRFRRILCCLIVICLITAALPITANAAYGNTCTLCKNGCSGHSTYSEPVHRLYGATRYETSFAIADALKYHLGVSRFGTIIVASGTNFADALAGSYLAAVKNAPILITNGKNSADIKTYIKNNLVSGGTVYLLGGTSALPASVVSGLNGYSVKRLWGKDRYETNLAILKEAGVAGKEILVCTGKNFADSLSASAVGKPILLVGNSLSDNQKAFLRGTSGKMIIIGGTSAVSTKVENQLFSFGSVERIGGSNRYETSVLVSKRFFASPSDAVVAYAQNFPDGLCGGPLAYSLGGPVILTATGKESTAVAYTNGNSIAEGYVLGGPKLISDSTAKKIFVERVDRKTRPSYNVGNCKNLEDSPYVIMFFLDDQESSWTQAEVDAQWNKQVGPGLEFLEDWAGIWGYELKFDVGMYYTGMSAGVKVKYNGIMQKNVANAWMNQNILEDISVSLGFSDKMAMDSYLQDFSGEDDIVYMVLVNKDGRSYSYCDDTDDGDDMLEHCVIFTDFEGYTYEVPASTVAHEVLHLFGAEDYYNPNGDTPNRHALAEAIYHDDIMLRVYTDVSYNNVGNFTAYTVGWIHTLPTECDTPQWWS